jgi:hypothetical protein
LGVARDLSARQRSLQYKTWSQFLAQLLRQDMGRPQTKQGFCGKSCLLPLNPGILEGVLRIFLPNVTSQKNKFKLISHKMNF